MNDELLRLIRDDAGHGEPAFLLRPGPVIEAGRCRVRARRTTLALRSAVVAVAVLCLAGVPVPAEGETPHEVCVCAADPAGR